MRGLISRAAMVAGAVAVLLGLAVGVASAARAAAGSRLAAGPRALSGSTWGNAKDVPGSSATWTVKPGGTITSTAGTTVLTDARTKEQVKCTKSSATATLKKGSGLSGTGIGSITKLSFSACGASFNFPAAVTVNNLPYKLNVTSFNAASGTTTGSITGIDATVKLFQTLGSCTMTVDGSGSVPNHTGRVKVTYTNSTHKLKVLASGGNLHLFNVPSPCPPFFASGDAVSFVGTYTVSPAQAITSP